MTRFPHVEPEQFQQAAPFPHIVLERFLPVHLADALAWEARSLVARPDLYKYENELERKRALDDVSEMPPTIRSVHQLLASPAFLLWLEQTTGIAGLVPDPYLRGGGVHLVPPGGKLDVHVDFNIHPKLGLARRLNVILYLNRNWTEEQGGHLELWDGVPPSDGLPMADGRLQSHVLLACERRILPLHNRLVIFETSERSYHGHPDPTQGDVWRCSLSAYYYTAPARAVRPHSTTFVARPTDAPSPELDEMREIRARGRLGSNVRIPGRED